MADHDELRRLAEAATPGPWAVERTDTTNWIGQLKGNGAHRKCSVVVVSTDRADCSPEYLRRVDADADYIAAASPDVVTGLLDEIDRLREQVERLSAGYADAIEDIEGWGVYASPYFQEKHDLQGDIAAHSETLHTFGTGKRAPELEHKK